MSAENIKEACGLFGICGNGDPSLFTVLGLFALQHRGEESVGIVSADGQKFYKAGGEGLVANVFDNQKTLTQLKGYQAIGHTRYSVTGASNKINIQPLVGELYKGRIAVAHNGNITNAVQLRQELERSGAIFQTTMDSEIVLHLVSRSAHPDLKQSIIEAVNRLQGSFNLLIMTADRTYAIRDPHGFRPLCLGKLRDANIVCSETSALDLVEAKYMGQVEPGEMVTVYQNRIDKEIIFPKQQSSSCIFEMIYFARPDSLIFGQSVYQFRKKAGRILAKEAPVEADLVIPVPDSGIYAALGYAEQARLSFEMAIVRNHYIGRTFIQPQQDTRESFTRIKLNPIKNVINNKRVVIIDDSIVRGTTTRHRIETIRAAGAKEIHMRIACPPIKHPCFYGIDFPNKKELIANDCSIAEIAKKLQLDSLAYISLKGLFQAADNQQHYCDACFTGKYPVPIQGKVGKDSFEC